METPSNFETSNQDTEVSGTGQANPTNQGSWLSKHKLLGYLFLAVVFAAIVGGVYIWKYGGSKQEAVIPDASVGAGSNQQTQTPDPTANWQTYTNAQYGFSFKYPIDLKVSESNPPNGTDVNVEFPSGSSLDIWEGSNSDIAGGTESNVFIDGKNYNMWTQAFTEGYVYTIILDQRQEIIFKNLGDNSDLNLFNQILSTFKFTGSADATADWKTYTNTQYGFDVKYPNDWSVSQGSLGINLIPNGASDVSSSIFVYDKPIYEAEKLLPIFSVPSRKIDSRTNVSISGINWDKLVVDQNQIIYLTYYNGRTYVFQHSIYENISLQILSTFKFTK